MKKFRGVLILIALSFLHCVDPGWNGEITRENGVEVIRNRGEGLWKRTGEVQEVAFEEVMTIGVEEGDPHYMFSHVSTAALDRQGVIYVVDGREDVIKKYSAEGQYLQSVGEHGQGPGQLLAPFVLAFDPDNRLFVADFENLRISIFSATGQFITAWPYRHFVAAMFFDADSHLVVHSQVDGRLFHRFNKSGEVEASFGEAWPPPGDQLLAHNHFLNVSTQILVLGDKLLLAPRLWPNQILIYSQDGSLFSRIERDAPELKPPYWHINTLVGANASGLFRINPELLLVTLASLCDYDDDKLSFQYDLYNTKGQFLTSVCKEAPGRIRWTDGAGYLIVTSNDPFPCVKKCKLLY